MARSCKCITVPLSPTVEREKNREHKVVFLVKASVQPCIAGNCSVAVSDAVALPDRDCRDLLNVLPIFRGSHCLAVLLLLRQYANTAVYKVKVSWWAKLAMPVRLRTAFFIACSWTWVIICTCFGTAGRQQKQSKKDTRLIPFSILTLKVVAVVERDGKKVDERRREKKKRISTAAHSLWICVALLLHLVSVTVVEAVCTPVIDSVSAANRGDLGLALDACLSESNNGVCPVFAQASNGVGCNNGGVNGVIGDWDVSALTNMQFVFKDKYYCNFDISKWDTSSVTIMEGSRWCLFSSFFNVVYRISLNLKQMLTFYTLFLSILSSFL